MRLWSWLLIKRVKTPKDFKLFQFRRAQTQSSLACSGASRSLPEVLFLAV
jgi:hypothetical protein